MINKILISSDFSPASWQATRFAVDLAVAKKAKISILHIIPSNDKSLENGKMKEKINTLKGKMDDITKKLMNGSSDLMDVVVLSGNIESTILEYIQSNGFDLIIVGRNSGGDSDEIGSHTFSILQKSQIPVMVVPDAK